MAYCTNLALMSESVSLNPVALLPGCERLSTSPMATGLPTPMNTMGMVDVRRLAATDALEPVGTNSSAPRWITSVTAWPGSPDWVQTMSSTISRFSTRPIWRKPDRNASTSERSYALDGEPNGSRPILTGLLACCARAASSPVRNAVAAPLSSVMNSRRLMSNTGGPPTASRRHRPDCHRHSSGRCDGRHRMVDCAGLGGRRMTSSALPQSKAPPLGMEFSFQAQDHNALTISFVRFLVAFPPPGLVTLRQTFVRRSQNCVGAGRRPPHCGIWTRLMSALSQKRKNSI